MLTYPVRVNVVFRVVVFGHVGETYRWQYMVAHGHN